MSTEFKRYTDKDENIRVSFDPSNFKIEGAVDDDVYIIGEIETEGETEQLDAEDCLLVVAREEFLRVLNEYLDGKKHYNKRDWLGAGIDPEGTPAIDFEEITPAECRDATPNRAFRVYKFASPDLEHG